MMNFEFDLLTQGRKNLLGLLRSFSDEQLNLVPPGFKNNLIWNLGHIIVSQQIICYKYSGITPVIPSRYIDLFKKGTAPDGSIQHEDIAILKELAIDTVVKLIEDFQNGIFKEYESFQSQYGVRLSTIEDAIVFNNTHEGIHLGYIMALIKSMK
jgi:hypothetical protein